MTGHGTTRILQAAGRMNAGGTETWLIHVLRHIDRERFQIDFLVDTVEPCHYDDEIRALGGHIVPCLDPTRPLTFAANLRRALRAHGPYDVVHSHLHGYSGFVLHLAHRLGVPARIAHSHVDTPLAPPRAGARRRTYAALMRRWIEQHATLELAASRQAATALFGPRWEATPHARIHHCAIDLSPFQGAVDRAAVRASLGIPADAFVVGHVGRFQEQKNHAFLVRIAAEVAMREPRARFLLVGDGPLRPAIEQQVAEAALADTVVFAGVRSDVSTLMLGAMDVLLLPSFNEGLPLVGIEAQAAGLPIVITSSVTPELDVVPELICRVPLEHSAARWGDAVLRYRGATAVDQPRALSAMQRSPFNIVHGVRELEQIYAAV